MSYFNKRASLIRNAFGSFIAEKDGVNVCIKCPKCGKHTSQKKKLVIKIDDGKFHCWVCGLKGSNISYLFRKYAPSHASKATEVFGGPKASFNRESLEEEKIDLAADLKGFTFLGDVRKNSDPDLKDVVRYAKKRGITTSMMWKYRLGACTQGQMRRRLIIPSFDSSGCINYYAAREIDGVSRMKYINAPVPKKEIIFNELLIDWNQPVALVEGPLDSIIGGENVICLLGSHLPEDSAVFKKIAKSKVSVYMSLDYDAKSKSEKISKMLSSFGIKVMEVNLPEDKDVADIGREKFKKLLLLATAWSQEKRLLRMISSIKTGSLL
mgnify:CR=1 FL=1